MKNHLAIWLVFCNFQVATAAQAMSTINKRYNGDAWRYTTDIRCVDDVRRLLACGMSIDVTDQNESTMLHYAAFSNKADVAQLLIRLGISLQKKDDRGRTALHNAISQSHQSLAMLISAVMIYRGIGLPAFESEIPETVQIGESLAMKVLRAEVSRSEYPIGRTRDEAQVIEFLKSLARGRLKSRI